MPHPALGHLALYRVPEIPSHLAALGFAPSQRGYLELAKLVSVTDLPAAPNPVTIYNMMAFNRYANHRTCQRLTSLLLQAGRERRVVVDPSIEEHEFLILGLTKKLRTIGQSFGISTSEVRISVARSTGFHTRLIRAMEGKFRTTESRCESLRDHVKTAFNFDLPVTNALAVKRPKGRPYVPIPPEQELPF